MEEVEPIDDPVIADVEPVDVYLEEIPIAEEVRKQPPPSAKRGLTGRDLVLLGIGIGVVGFLGLAAVVAVLVLH